MIEKYVDYLGADPEFFFEKGSKVLESGAVVKEKGGIDTWGKGKIIKDGFQGEFNPSHNTCRQSFMWNIFNLMYHVNQMGYKVRLGAGYWIPETEFADLTNDSKVFGCIPSENIYGRQPLGADPMKYMFRPAGGHIHLSLGRIAKKHVVDLVKLLDIMVGNTSVAFDQDPLSTERRKNYGRAGEFRLKSYGVEYRTLSNFWLSHYIYGSMVFGLARQAISIVEYTDDAKGLIELIGADAETAINTNDKKLAIKNFKKLKEYFTTKFKVEDEWEDQKFTLTNLTYKNLLNAMEFGFDFDKSELNLKKYVNYLIENNTLDSGIEQTLLHEYTFKNK